MTLREFVAEFVVDDSVFRRARVIDRPRRGLVFPDGTANKQLLDLNGDSSWMSREVHGVEATTYEWEGHELPCLLIVLDRARQTKKGKKKP